MWHELKEQFDIFGNAQLLSCQELDVKIDTVLNELALASRKLRSWLWSVFLKMSGMNGSQEGKI